MRSSVLAALVPVLAAGLLPGSLWSQDPFEGKNKGKFSILRDAELTVRLDESKRLLAAGKRRAAVEALLAVLRAGPAFVDEADKSSVIRGSFVGGSFVGLRESARLELGKLDAASRDIYQSMVKGELEAPVRDALIRRDEAALSLLASRFPYTDAGERARLAAGDLALERGDFLAALQSFSLFDGPDPDGKILFRKLLCRKLLDLPIRNPNDRLEQEFTGQQYGYSSSFWPAYGGGLDGTRLQGDATRPDSLAWSRPLLGIGNIQYNMHAVTDGRKIFVNTGTVVEGLDLLTGRGWQQRSPLLEHPERQEFERATSSRHILSSALGQGVLVAPLQVPIKTDEGSERISFRGIPIMARLPVRRLFAFDSENGKLLWSHWNPDANGEGASHKIPLDTCGPPTIVGDRIYVPTHKLVGGISYYVSAFDLHTGRLLWKTLLLSSQIEVNMFGNAQWEFSASPLAFADGVIYGCTNLGAAFSLRCDDGSIRWLREYEVTQQPRTRMYVEEREVYWGNNPPIVSDGVCVLTPLDANYAIALDTKTGVLNWRVESYVRRADNLAEIPEVFWMLGSADGYVYFQGHALTRVPIKAKRKGRLLHQEVIIPPVLMGMQHHPDRKFIARGVLTKDRIYLPIDRQGVAVYDHLGKRLRSKHTASGQQEMGSLLIAKDILFSLSCPASNSLQLDAFFSHADLLARARRKTETDPDSPKAWLDLSELLISDPTTRSEALAEAARGFEQVLTLLKREGEKAGPGSRARRGLFKTRLRLALSSYPVDRKAAFQDYQACLELGRQLANENQGEKRLVQLMVELLDRYPEKRVFRKALLDELSQDHGKFRFQSPRLGRVPIALYVILERLSDLPRTRASAPTRLQLLREILLDHGSVVLDGESARTIALERSRGLLERYGREIYAAIEKKARALLEEASDDPARLKQVLEQFPLSDTARFALIHLARSAAQRGDLSTCLDTWDLARTRLEGIPKELPPALAQASRKHGNLALCAAFEALASGQDLPSRHLALEDELPLPPLVELSPSLPLVGASMAASTSLFLPSRMPGFSRGGDPLPLLLHDEQNQLLGFEPGPKGRGFVFERPFIRLHFERDLYYSLEACIQGRILILPDSEKVRAYDLDKGRLLWSQQMQHILASGPLRTGLYAWVTSNGEGEDHSLFLEAREPLTGKRVFKVQLLGVGDYDDIEFREGFFFHLTANPQGTGKRLTLRDGLTGKVNREFDFDGTHLPLLDPSPAGILFTDSELFFMGSPEGSGRYRLYAYDHSGKRLWTSRERRLGARDSYRVLPEQVFLAANFGKAAEEGLAWFLDRKSGKMQRKVRIGFQARLLGRPREPALQDGGPFVMTGRNQQNRLDLYYLDPDPAQSSWVAPMPGASTSSLVQGSPLLGKTYLCLAQRRSHAKGGFVDLRLLDRNGGNPKKAPRRKGIPSSVEIATWNGQLLVHARFDHTWVYADRMGK